MPSIGTGFPYGSHAYRRESDYESAPVAGEEAVTTWIGRSSYAYRRELGNCSLESSPG